MHTQRLHMECKLIEGIAAEVQHGDAIVAVCIPEPDHPLALYWSLCCRKAAAALWISGVALLHPKSQMTQCHAITPLVFLCVDGQ